MSSTSESDPEAGKLDNAKPSAEKPLAGVPILVKDNISVTGTAANLTSRRCQEALNQVAVEALVKLGACG
jgi:amidase